MPSKNAEQEPELVPGSISGFRLWRIVKPDNLLSQNPFFSGPDYTLAPLYAGRGYWAERTLRATCRKILLLSLGLGLKNSNHKSPDPDCTCGIYARHDWWDLWDQVIRSSVVNDLVVFGEIKATGLVINAERGFRAERAEIQFLAPIRDPSAKERHILNLISEQYDVPMLPSYSYYGKNTEIRPPDHFDPSKEVLEELDSALRKTLHYDFGRLTRNIFELISAMGEQLVSLAREVQYLAESYRKFVEPEPETIKMSPWAYQMMQAPMSEAAKRNLMHQLLRGGA